MDSKDICDLDEFKNDPICKNKKCSVTTNLFWCAVLIAVAFFMSTWNSLINRLIDKMFGSVRSDFQLYILAAVALAIVLILGCIFEVDLEY
jgi:hypothetical protein